MGGVKDIIIKVIPASVANPFVRKVHYSGKVVQNSQVHFGCFLDGKLHGVLSYGPSMDKARLIGLVEGTDYEVIYQNASFDGGIATQIAQTFSAENVDIMVGIATPSATAKVGTEVTFANLGISIAGKRRAEKTPRVKQRIGYYLACPVKRCSTPHAGERLARASASVYPASSARKRVPSSAVSMPATATKMTCARI